MYMVLFGPGRFNNIAYYLTFILGYIGLEVSCRDRDRALQGLKIGNIKDKIMGDVVILSGPFVFCTSYRQPTLFF